MLRIEPNISVRLEGSSEFGTRTEIKNLNSFRALERSVAFEIERQSRRILEGGKVVQETRGWDENMGETVSQRIKEEAEDYRYFPEPDLPPLVIQPERLAQIQLELPETPASKNRRFQKQYGLNAYDSAVLTEEIAVADYFEAAAQSVPEVPAKIVANWIIGDLFSLLNQASMGIDQMKIQPKDLAGLVALVHRGEISQTTARNLLTEMFPAGGSAAEMVAERGLSQISDRQVLEEIVRRVLAEHPEQVRLYLEGKTALFRWFFGQVMRLAGGRANPKMVDEILLEKFGQKKPPNPVK